jgi:predicted transcriptional regulator
VSAGLDAPASIEKPYIEKVRQQFYASLANMPVPLSAANFQQYGCSTTTTIVLLDAAGKVRFYHPGALTEQELSARIVKVLSK